MVAYVVGRFGGPFAATTMLLLTWSDFRLGRSVCGAQAGYHAYLEYVLLLLFILAWRRPIGKGDRHGT